MCRVAYCRYPNSHTTQGHQCGTCKEYGHGQVECNNPNKIQQLKQCIETLDENIRCTKPNCLNRQHHQPSAHLCVSCWKYGDACNCEVGVLQDTCYICGDKHETHKCEFRINTKYDCPTCRTKCESKDDRKTFCQTTCTICLEIVDSIISSKCGHTCCPLCHKKLLDQNQNQDQDQNIETKEEIRFRSLLEGGVYREINTRFAGVTDKVSTIVNAGMGCVYFVRTSGDGTFTGYFMHNDNWGQYGERCDDRPKLARFLHGFRFVI